jgi:hypothetical protein
MNVVANAVLTSIIGPGTTLEPNGDPSEGEEIWTGRAGGYIKREKRSRKVGDQYERGHIDVFTILTAAGAPNATVLAGADWEACSVVIEDQRTVPSVTRQFRVTAAENRAAGTIADSLRIELEAESAVAA